MLSLILSWLFRFAFLITALATMINITVQVKQAPVALGGWKMGLPGIQAAAFRTNPNQRDLPDTVIKYSILGKDAHERGAGELPSARNFGPAAKERILKMIDDQRKEGNTIVMDTQLTAMVHRNWPTSMELDDVTGSTFEPLADGRAVYVTSTHNSKTGKRGPTKRDTFPDMWAAKRFSVTNSREEKHQMSLGGTITETIWVRPVGTKQHILFVLHTAVISACITLLMLTLSRLFRNFHQREYFTIQNVKHLRNIGWLLLIPQLLQLLVYWAFLFRIHPAVILVKAEEIFVNETATYQFNTDVQWILVFLGLGILTLSYIFKNGLAIKEEHALMI